MNWFLSPLLLCHLVKEIVNSHFIAISLGSFIIFPYLCYMVEEIVNS